MTIISEHDIENGDESAEKAPESIAPTAPRPATPAFSLQRLWSYVWRETLELQRDPVRATLALVGSLVLMVFGAVWAAQDTLKRIFSWRRK